jgi:hypothetical protein
VRAQELQERSRYHNEIREGFSQATNDKVADDQSVHLGSRPDDVAYGLVAQHCRGRQVTLASPVWRVACACAVDENVNEDFVRARRREA